MSEDLEVHRRRMRAALRQARLAADEGEVPVGAAIYRAGHLIAQAHNQVEQLKDATAHAEMIALTQAAAAVGDWRLADTVLYVTKEPCPMCAGAVVLARIPLVIWGLTDPLRGGAVSRFQILQSGTLNHRTEYIAGVRAEECAALLQQFFHDLRRSSGAEASDPQPET
ncbi:MAG: nucleoside deaminase [Kiritimatiellaeota bacterium]|nr:nucleoside deaminase [Kiritimatiellota bacterium]